MGQTVYQIPDARKEAGPAPGLLRLFNGPVRRLNHVENLDDEIIDHDSCTHVIIRPDATWKPLQLPSEGPYKLLERSPRHFSADVGEGKIFLLGRKRI